MIFEIISGNGRGRKFTFPDSQPVVIGRDPGCDLHLDDDQCSRRHARVSPERGRLVVADLESTNGLFLNGVRCDRGGLTSGDQIRLANTVLRVDGLPPRPSAPASLNVDDRAASVVVSLHHTQADLLGKTGAPLVPEEVVHENRILRQICEITQAVAAGADLASVLIPTLDRTRAILGADTACILVRSDDGEWRIRALSSGAATVEGITVSRTIVQEAVREGVAILSENPMSDERFAGSMSIARQNLASVICSPLKLGGSFVGVVVLDRRGHGAAFKAMDLRFVATVGNLIAMLMEKEQLQIAARQRERLATIGEVMTGMAHGVKNIVAALRFSVASLKLVIEKKKYEAVQSSLQSVLDQERRISDMVLDMLSYAKERAPLREELDVSAVIDSVTAPHAAALADKRIELRIVPEPGCPRVWAEERALHGAFLNLFTNAVDALQARAGEAPRQIAISLRPVADASAIEVRFRDTGTGIQADRLAKVFDPFFSTKGSGGTGLGLAVTQKTICEHGGSIAVDSRENEWTEFRITLPVGHRPTQASITHQEP